MLFIFACNIWDQTSSINSNKLFTTEILVFVCFSIYWFQRGFMCSASRHISTKYWQWQAADEGCMYTNIKSGHHKRTKYLVGKKVSFWNILNLASFGIKFLDPFTVFIFVMLQPFARIKTLKYSPISCFSQLSCRSRCRRTPPPTAWSCYHAAL